MLSIGIPMERPEKENSIGFVHFFEVPVSRGIGRCWPFGRMGNVIGVILRL